MKIKITLLVMMAFIAMGYVSATDIKVDAQFTANENSIFYDDATLGYSGNDNLLLMNQSRGIDPGVDTKISAAFIRFQLPPAPGGKKLVAASLTLSAIQINLWVNANVDLYGINFRKDKALSNSDWYVGDFTEGPNVGNGSDWGIMKSYFVVADKDAVPTPSVSTPLTRTTDGDANAQLLAFLQKQYEDGAVNYYTFFRLNLDNPASAGSQRYWFDKNLNDSYYPRLNLTFSFKTSTDNLASNTINSYVNPQGQLVINGQNIKGSTLSVYSIDGKEMIKESITNDNFTSFQNLIKGVYIIKISKDSNADIIQKIIVQ